MFTGIVEHTGKVSNLTGDGSVLAIDAPSLTEVPVGGSVSVNGACLTVVESTSTGARFDVIPETLARTNLGQLHVGDLVNLELAMSAAGRFDGHIVQGHVDGTGTVVSIMTADNGTILTISAPDLVGHIVEKGSITVDGVSLTVATVGDEEFAVALIPHTLEITTLGSLGPGDRVNLETDIIAKYVQRLVGESKGTS